MVRIAQRGSRLAGLVPRRMKRWILLVTDAVLVSFAIYFALALRFETWTPTAELRTYFPAIAALLPLQLASFQISGLYRPVLRYVGFDLLVLSSRAILLSTLLTVFCGFFFRLGQLPRSVLANDALLALLFVVGVRLSIRWVLYNHSSPLSNGAACRYAVIYGAGAAGSQLARALEQDHTYRVLAFVDDDPQLHGQRINGTPVFGPASLPRLFERFTIETILLAMPSATGDRKRDILQQLRRYPARVKTVPGIVEILSGQVTIRQVREIEIADLLGREEVSPYPQLLRVNIAGKGVLVTGAGGSIGSELCRQIAQQPPRVLVLYELNELALYTIDMELAETYPDLPRAACLGSVADAALLRKAIATYSIDTIYHAAAYKHVPLVEMNPTQGALNNVGGTYVAARVARECGVKNFVLISTDKAVRPTSVMGATKRVAEMVLQALAAEGGATQFAMVRFGNVLNSNGSVVPRFRKQIAEGKPITITHPEITRYFMSIPEAARLVIQAGALGRGGEVFLLDMGKPVKIYDLAVQMIELSGLVPDRDIEIRVVGLRPGEKLYEELLIEANRAVKTCHPKIFSAKEAMLPWEQLEPLLDQLLAAARGGDRDRTLALLRQLVPEYCKTVRAAMPKALSR